MPASPPPRAWRAADVCAGRDPGTRHAASWNEPALTTVEQPIDEIAETAIEALRILIGNRSQSLPNYVFRPRLRLGRSTGPLNGAK